MPRDYSKPPRNGGGRPKRDGFKPGGFTKKPWERRERPDGERGERGERSGYSRSRSDDRGERSYKPRVEGREDRPYSKPYGEKRGFGGPKREFGERKEFRPRRDDELFKASGKVAEIVGNDPQSRFEILRKLWNFFSEEGLVTSAGRVPRANAGDWRSEGDEAPPRRRFRDDDEGERPRAPRTPRKPAGNHPTARKARTLEGVPRRKYKETRER